MFCPKCGNEMIDGGSCVQCRYDDAKRVSELMDSTHDEALNKYLTMAKLFYGSAIVPVMIGFYKMYVYKSNESYYSKSVNAYVGGDAYNFIINANYSTAWFVLGLLLAVVGSACLICYELNRRRI